MGATRFSLGTALVAGLLLAGCASVPAPPPQDLRVAVTVDDLPAHGDMPPGETPVSVARKMIAAVKRAGIDNVYGFVNGHWADERTDYLKVLAAWTSAGLPVANHGWLHRNLSEITLAEFEQEVARNEPLLEMISDGNDWRWFRYPDLDEGETADKRIGSRRILRRRGYRLADVTMDFSDWRWNAPYARCKETGNEAAIAWLEQTYLAAARESIGYYRHLSQRLYGRDIPYVLVLHMGAFDARMLPRLLKLFGDEGFRFVGLEEAQQDPAYADQMNLELPPLPEGLEGKAMARGIPLPSRTRYAETLKSICRPTHTHEQ